MLAFGAARRYSIAMLSITWLALAVRVINLSGDSFWFDELWTLDAAGAHVATIAAGQDVNNPPGYLLMAHGAVQLAGNNEYALRFPSALAGALTIPLVYVTGSVLLSRRVGVWAALLLALSPFHIRYSQEARAYAVQALFAMWGTASLLLALVRERRLHWLGFGLATVLGAYAQFSAFIVLGCQLVFAGLYGLIERARRTWSTRRLLQAAAGGTLALALAGALYAPYFSAAWAGVSGNLGGSGWAGNWSGVTIFDRLGAAYYAFGAENAIVAALVGGLAVIGLARAVLQRRIDQVSWLLISVLLPFGVIAVAGVARAPLAKNVFFVLPPYLIAAAGGLDFIVGKIHRSIGQSAQANRAASVVAGVVVMALALAAVPTEHARSEEDWRSIAAYVQQVGGHAPVIVPVTLDLPDGFNQGYDGLRHYLPQYLTSYYLLQGEHLTDPRVADLSGAQQAGGDVWLIVLKRDVPLSLPDAEFEVKVFQGGTYVVRPRRSALPLESMLAVYPRLIEQARTPCYLWLDTARLHLELDQFAEARAALDQVRQPCPNSLGTRQALHRYLLDHYLQTQQTAEARTMARQLLVWDAKDKVAIQALTIVDLNTLYASADPAVAAQPSPARPIDTQRFTMPDSGDWGDALVMQTPAAVSFRLALPPEPVQFVSRVAMFPDSWEWGGDGADFRLSVQAEDEQSVTLYERYVSNALPDRTWHGVDVSLAAFAGRAITLTLETAPGPSGDTTGDWAGWDSPRIVFEAAGTP